MELFGLAISKARACADIGIFVLAEAYPRSEAGIEATKPTKKKARAGCELVDHRAARAVERDDGLGVFEPTAGGHWV